MSTIAGLPGWLRGKNLPANIRMPEIWVQSLGQEDPLKKETVPPFQYSCLDKPRDRGAWQATVCGVTNSWTWLSDWARAQVFPLPNPMPRSLLSYIRIRASMCPCLWSSLAKCFPRDICFITHPNGAWLSSVGKVIFWVLWSQQNRNYTTKNQTSVTRHL